MEVLEIEGDTIDQAIENALITMGVERDKITVEILSEGKKGILGFGAQKARIRASLRRLGVDPRGSESKPSGVEQPTTQADAEAIGEKGKSVLEEILRLMGIEASVKLKAGEKGNEAILEIRAENNGLLIGYKGQTLEALQYLVSRIAGERQGNESPHLVLDIENYRERRRRSLEDMALQLGEKAKRQRKTITVEALGAADRRIIHEALQDDPWLTTKSLGQGSYRRLLIIPEGDRKKKEETNSPSPEKQTAKVSK